MASKLHIWNMVPSQFKKAVYMDADVIALRSPDRLFQILNEKEDLQIIGEGGVMHKYINAGVLAIRPNNAVYERMISMFEKDRPPNIFPNLVDCTEMALINKYFMTYHGFQGSSDYDSQVMVLKTDPRSADLYIGRPDIFFGIENLPLAVHFVRADTCIKPWVKNKARNSRKCLAFPYLVWEYVYGAATEYRSVQK